MEETIFVKPKAGLQIRRPDTKAFLSENGERVPKSNFWARRILDGDVTESEEMKQKQQPQADVAVEAEEPQAQASRKNGGR